MAIKQKNKNILMHYKGHEEFVSKVIDIGEKARRYQTIIYTSFLNEYEQQIVKEVLSDLHVYCDGGNIDNELKRCAISNYEEENIVFPIACLRARYDTKFSNLNHRDVLGALMNLGLEREKIGDIIVDDGNIYIYVCEELKDYMMMNATQVKRTQVSFKVYEGEVENKKELAYKEKIISSMRLDSVVAACINCNREKAKRLIQGGHVKVNQIVLEESAYVCNNKSTVSIKRYGRFIVELAQRKTRKDKCVVEIGKYI